MQANQNEFWASINLAEKMCNITKFYHLVPERGGGESFHASYP